MSEQPHIIVAGDVILDEYTLGRPLKIAEDGPTIVATLDEVKTLIGGAGLIARHLLRLGCKVTLISFCGENESIGDLLFKSSDPPLPEEERNIIIHTIPIPGSRLPQKKRYFVNSHKFVQYDAINEGKHDWNSYITFCNFLASMSATAFICAENRHGFWDVKMANEVINWCQKKKIPIFVDCQYAQKSPNHHWFSGADYFFLNEKEFKFYNDNSSIPLWQRLKKINDEFGREGEIILKLGANGAISYNKEYNDIEVSPGYEVKVFDPVGAGDAFLAAFVSEKFKLVGLRNLNESYLDFSNRWAALSCTKIGTIVPKIEELDTVTRGQ